MFLIMGMNTQQKSIKELTLICEHCGAYGHFTLYATYQQFSLFFIPLFKWGYQYYVTSSCCGSVYSIDSEVAKQIQRGERDSFTYEDLTLQNEGSYRCPNCHSLLERKSAFCPNCGANLFK